MEEKKRKVKALVAVDNSEPSERAVILSGRFAKETGVNLTLLHVIDNPESYKEIPDDWKYKPRVKEAEDMLNRFKRLAEANGAKDVQTMLTIGSVSDEIVKVAEENEFDYIVLGTKGMGALKRFFLGSVADKVVHRSHLPVVVTRIIEKEKRVPFKREGEKIKLLVAVDDSRASEKAVLGTSQFAGSADLHITLIHVLEDVVHYDEIPDTYIYNLRKEEAKRILNKSKAIAEAIGIKDVDTKIVAGPIEEEINRASAGYASIVLGWKDGTIFSKLLSSAPRPIVIIR